jgi:DGQHR domain-containing protein
MTKKSEATKVSCFRFTQRTEGKPYELYVTALPAEMLQERGQVYTYDAGNRPNGYQRRPAPSRIRDIAKYVEKNEGLLPTAVLVNLRDTARFEPIAGPVADGGPVAGTLVIEPDEVLWIVDGQHRTFGIQEASARLREQDPDATLGYEIPVVFTVGLDLDEEMRLFHVVNSRAKSVPTDLAAQLLLEAVRKEGKKFVHSGKGNEKEFRKAVGTRVAIHLNTSPGPWQGKIRLPNEPTDRAKKPLQLNAIASSLEPALKGDYFKSIVETEMAKEWPTLRGLVHTYWVALASLMPEAFEHIGDYSVQRTAGVYAFHMLLPDVIYRCLQRRDFSVGTFKEILGSLGRWVDSHTWHMEEGEGLTRSTGMSAIRVLADTMREMLPPVETPGLAATA